ncbi:MAG: DUF3052 domain-containing protein [Planctomycetes bacterium]|nr:DUF3052 domain-containing protein [Planctomycetota bacterium]MBI3844184.1 DUF3052 domain-containing protein [Planctomycetota bacterium]
MPAGYSGTPLPKKLGIKPGHRVLLVNAPAEFRTTLGELPQDVALVDSGTAKAPFDVIIFFTKSAANLEKRFAALAAKLTPAGGLWISWPKKASGVATDLTDNVVREMGLAGGLVDVKVCAVDDTWSGLRFVIRVKDRPKPAR